MDISVGHTCWHCISKVYGDLFIVCLDWCTCKGRSLHRNGPIKWVLPAFCWAVFCHIESLLRRNLSPTECKHDQFLVPWGWAACGMARLALPPHPALVAGFEAARAASACAPHQVPTFCEQWEMLWFSRTSWVKGPGPPKNCLCCILRLRLLRWEEINFK